MVERATQLIKKIFEGTVLLIKRSTLHMDHGNRHPIYLEIGEDRVQRTMRRFLLLLQSKDYHVFLRAHPSRRTFANARLLRWHDNVSLIWRGPAGLRPEVLWSDRLMPVDGSERPRYGKVIHVQYDYRPQLELGPGHFPVPMSMHPQIYERYRDHVLLPGHRQAERKMRIFFAGAWNSAGYDDPIMSQVYHIESRYRVLRFLQDSGFARLVRSEHELDNLLAGAYTCQFVLLDSQLRINQARWLSMLAQADFFLCPPGVKYPPSHNAVEAMAVGTIPLINYPHWFSPALTDMVNCVAFAKLDELESAIGKILKMDRQRIEAMRQCVIDYYSANLDVDVLARRILDYPADDLYLHMSEENDDSMRHALSV